MRIRRTRVSRGSLLGNGSVTWPSELVLEFRAQPFFEDAEPINVKRSEPSLGFAEDSAAPFETPYGSTSEAHALAKAFSRIGDARIRRRVIDLVETLADASR